MGIAVATALTEVGARSAGDVGIPAGEPIEEGIRKSSRFITSTAAAVMVLVPATPVKVVVVVVVEEEGGGGGGGGCGGGGEISSADCRSWAIPPSATTSFLGLLKSQREKKNKKIKKGSQQTRGG
jgi:hypothetical protein